MSKKILGLDLGTNSIGWALVDKEENKILGLGSRIIPMTQDTLGKFSEGASVSQTAERTRLRSMRRLRERHLLRRERLHRVLNLLGWLPPHYASQIDFNGRLGKFFPEKEPKLAYEPTVIDYSKIHFNFIFKESLEEMYAAFNQAGHNLKVPFDWTIYYLRTKALREKISSQELAWIILNFNQKRGYYQLRGEDVEENPGKLVEFHSLAITDVIADEKPNPKGETWYSLVLENGWIYRRSSKISLIDWKGKKRDFIVTTDLNEDGTIKVGKDGNEKRSFRAPGEDDWTLLKKKTENEIALSGKTVGEYIFDHLLVNPHQKIKGKLVKTIERKFYKQELIAILQKQAQYHPELSDSEKYNDCIRELYKHNEQHQLDLTKRDLSHLFVEDIIFYQRPLKSKKSTIANCNFEVRYYKDDEGKVHSQPLKAIPKSHPLFQEFRVWQWIQNLAIFLKTNDQHPVTCNYLSTEEDYEELFDHLMSLKEIDQVSLLKYLLKKKGFTGKGLSNEAAKYRWNYVYDAAKDDAKKYPMNETGAQIRSRLEKVKDVSQGFLDKEKELHLWHIIYSITDREDYRIALVAFAKRYGLNQESFVEAFIKFPPFKSEYGSFSEKALKKLVPLMRHGRYWRWENIDNNLQERIRKIINGEFDPDIPDRVREFARRLEAETDFKFLPMWLASYIVYGRHSEAAETTGWESPHQLDQFLKNFKHHSLRNPIVEQVTTEALRVVRDIWQQYGKGEKHFFDEIHIELGRDLKKTKEERERLSKQMNENEATNLRIKLLLAEMAGYTEMENVRPYSPVQQEILKLYEEGVLRSAMEVPEEIEKITKTPQPSGTDLRRYKLWLEQKYRSPYTGNIIPLNRLFTAEYQMEHIIPRKRFYDDSFSNKVICEAAVNSAKDAMLGLEFIQHRGGEVFHLGMNRTATIFTEEQYRDFVNQHYAKVPAKKRKLLMDEIPEQMVERQLNDTRYLSRYLLSILSRMVRAETNDDGYTSKNVVPVTGMITSELKKDWGMDDVWNDLILPRFERMNKLTNSTAFTTWNERHQKYLPTVPLELSRNFQKKRIDHRHHAMDALVIACTTRDHVNFLNNQHAIDKTKSKEEKDRYRYDLRSKLCTKKYNDRSSENYSWQFKKPWENFTTDAKTRLETVVVSFKKNLRIINKSTNYYESWVEKNGNKVKELVKQTKGKNWAIRKPLHKDTVSGLIKLRRIKEVNLSVALDEISSIVDKEIRRYLGELVKQGYNKKKISELVKNNKYEWNGKNLKKISVYYWEVDEHGLGTNASTRQALDISFDKKRIETTIADTAIQKILLAHLERYVGKVDEKGKPIPPELLAFSPEGIEDMNKDIVTLNNGKFHQPIYKVRTYEPKGNKFAVGEKGNKNKKFVEAADGTNLFFAVYVDKNGKRNFETIPLNIALYNSIEGAKSSSKEIIPPTNNNGDALDFYLSPLDLVYVHTGGPEEILNLLRNGITTEDTFNIYRFIDGSGTTANFVPHSSAALLFNMSKKEQEKRGLHFPIQNEFGVGSPQSKNQKSLDGQMIKDTCIKLEVDRLGNVKTAKKLHVDFLSVKKDAIISPPAMDEIKILTSHER